jgi:hypothetical protein
MLGLTSLAQRQIKISSHFSKPLTGNVWGHRFPVTESFVGVQLLARSARPEHK